jgi:hypothetical protein
MAVTVPAGSTTQVKKVVTEPNVKVAKVVVGRPVRRVTSGAFRIENLSDADTTGIQDGSLLVYKTSTQKWTATIELDNQNLNGGSY